MKISRKLISLVLITLFLMGSTAAYAASAGRDLGHDAGDVAGNNSSRYDFDAHRTFRLVRYVPSAYSATSATLATESLVTWSTVSDDGVTVTTTTTSYDSAIAGVIVQVALTPTTADAGNTAKQDLGRRNWTWLQTYGKVECRVSAVGGVNVGAAIGASETAGEAAEFLASTTDATAQGNGGFWYDTAAKGTDNVEAFLRCE